MPRVWRRRRAVMSAGFGIKGFLDTSFVDWPGRLAAVLFLGGCNFRCPFCHNPDLVLRHREMPDIPPGEVLAALRGLRGWVDGVVVSGGEPTVSPRLPELLRALRAEGLEVKLDTNGSRPDVLRTLARGGLVQAVAMDLKAPLDRDLYARAAGVAVPVEAVGESIGVLSRAGVDLRLRTTWVPGMLETGDLLRMRSLVPGGASFEVQGFEPRRVLDPRLAGLRPVPEEELRRLRALCRAEDPLLSPALC